MVTYGQLKDAKPGLFDDAAGAFAALKKAVNDHIDSLEAKQSALKDVWSSDGGDSAVDAIRKQYTKLSDAVTDLGKIKNTLIELAEEVRQAKNRLAKGQELADAASATITDSGTVETSFVSPGIGPPAPPPEALIDPNAGEIKRAQELIDDALDKATKADTKAADELGGLEPPLHMAVKAGWEVGGFTVGAADYYLELADKAGKWLGPVGHGFTLAGAGSEQWMKDRYDPDLNNWQRAGRVAYATTVEGGTQVAFEVAATAGIARLGGGAPAGYIAGADAGEAGGTIGEAVNDATIDRLPFW